jgi:Fe-S-cluster containining protein
VSTRGGRGPHGREPIPECQSCGACCKNLPDNAAQGFTSYVEVEPHNRLLEKKDLVRKLVVLDAEGVPHMRLAPDGRCLALAGRIGDDVRCTIYFHRPSACRRVEAGSKLCLSYRRAHGVD